MILSVNLLVVLAVALGGALGSVGRFLLDRYLPQGILIANTVGCLILGAFYGGLDAYQASVIPLSEGNVDTLMGLVSVGLTGALTTFATLSLRVFTMWLSGEHLRAVGIWTLHTVCGLAAALVGIWLAASIVTQFA